MHLRGASRVGALLNAGRGSGPLDGSWHRAIVRLFSHNRYFSFKDAFSPTLLPSDSGTCVVVGLRARSDVGVVPCEHPKTVLRPISRRVLATRAAQSMTRRAFPAVATRFTEGVTFPTRHPEDYSKFEGKFQEEAAFANDPIQSEWVQRF